MDPARYGLQQRWDSNSALDGYGAAGEPNFRGSGSYNGRRLIDEGFRDDNVYPRGNVHRSIFDRDAYQPTGQSVGAWPQSRRDFGEEYSDFQESKRHGKAHSFHEVDEFRGVDKYRGSYHDVDGYHDVDDYHHYGFDHHYRLGGRDNEVFNDDTYEYRHRGSRYSRESSHEIDHDLGRYEFDTEHDRGRRDNGWRRRESRDSERDTRDQIYERDASPHGRWGHSRSRSRGRDDQSRSRSPRGRSHGKSRREDSYDDSHYDRIERWKDRDHDEKRHTTSVGPSATVVVKGLSQKTSEEDLYQILAKWGPLRHVRVIRERNFGTSRGFAFIDFPTVGAARNMMDAIGDEGLVFDGRKIFFEYSSKPTGGAGAMGHENSVKSGHFRSVMQSDWMCTICGCVNFARRTSCFQCNEGRTDDAPLADVASANINAGKKGSDSGPSHVLVVRGLDENADDEMLRYEFSKHAPIKDIRLVRDKFTHVSRGFAFVHFHSVEDATKALEATNGIKLEKNGQILRVAYAKSIHGPGASGSSQSSSLAAAAIEAAAFSQQYDAVGWAPKEYNSDDKQVTGLDEKLGMANQDGGSAVQSGFVWDEASGYYYDSTSGFYYDGNTGLYYDGNSGTWFSYDHQTQQYVPCTDQNNNGESSKSENRAAKSSEPVKKKVVISAPAAMTTSKEKVSLPDSIQAAAAAALAAEKKEKDKTRDIKLASKSSISANKKKMSNVLTMWKQRNHEGQAARVVLDDKQASGTEDRPSGLSAKPKSKHEALGPKDSTVSLGFSSPNAGQMTSSSSLTSATQSLTDSQITPRPVGNSSGGSIMGVIRSSGRGVVKSDTKFSGFFSGETAANNSSSPPSTSGTPVSSSGAISATMPFRTDAAALGSYAPSVTTGKRRFSEMPLQPSSKEQPQVVYRDRAAERRSLYGSSSVGDTPDLGMGDSNHDFSYRKGSSSDIGAMPFPPGVGGGHVGSDTQRYEVVPADRAIGENNVGNRMLRNMGWQEGSGLGRDGSGITEPVQALGMGDRAGLGRHQRKIDPDLEVQAGDSYRTLIQKKAIARFREMSQ